MMKTLICSPGRPRFGFSLIETLITLSVLSIVVGALAPMFVRQINHARVNGAAQVIAGDLETALSLAQRQRRPVRVTVDGTQRAVVITDRASGQTIARRVYGPLSDYKVQTLTLAPATFDILPHGVATSAATLTVGTSGYTRRVTITRAGYVRLQP
jgi:prepilin-type N-terminal cleavage/methylation domain-containing protein